MRTDWPARFVAKRRAGGLLNLARTVAALEGKNHPTALGPGEPFLESPQSSKRTRPHEKGLEAGSQDGGSDSRSSLSSQDSAWEPFQGSSGENSEFEDPEAQEPPPDYEGEAQSGSSRGESERNSTRASSRYSGSRRSGQSEYSSGHSQSGSGSRSGSSRGSGGSHGGLSSEGSHRRGGQDEGSCSSSGSERSSHLGSGPGGEGGSAGVPDRGEGRGALSGSDQSGSGHSGLSGVFSKASDMEPDGQGSSSDGNNRVDGGVSIGAESNSWAEDASLPLTTLSGVQWGLNPLVSGRTMTPSM